MQTEEMSSAARYIAPDRDLPWAPESAGDGARACLPLRAQLSEFIGDVRVDVAPVRAAVLGVVVYFADKWLYRRIKYGSADLALQLPGIWVDELGRHLRHGFFITSHESAGLQ